MVPIGGWIRGRLGALVLLASTTGLLLPATARATWSIVAVDPHTREVGVAVASCVEAPAGNTLLPQVAGLAPGVGALAAQALYDSMERNEALMRLAGGAAPRDLIDGVLAGDPLAAMRQYGVVTLDLQVATYTGDATRAWSGDVRGTGVAVQGNLLHGPEVLDEALAAFEADPPAHPWTLADRLMAALEAGAAQGGDARCPAGQSALAAALRVARPTDPAHAPSIDLRIPSQPRGGADPVALLRTEFDRWRHVNPPDGSTRDPMPQTSPWLLVLVLGWLRAASRRKRSPSLAARAG